MGAGEEATPFRMVRCNRSGLRSIGMTPASARDLAAYYARGAVQFTVRHCMPRLAIGGAADLIAREV
ncbi:MAG: hypothetical protein NVS4B3_27640 [Gemmatimonadaceae bacterium]